MHPQHDPGVLNNQNVPGAVYDSESGFTNALASAHADVLDQCSYRRPTHRRSGQWHPFSNIGGSATNIAAAGIATQGTRLYIGFSSIPAGSTVSAPNCVNLANVIGLGVTGIAVQISGTSSTGFGGTPVSLTNCLTTNTVVAGVQLPSGIAAPGFVVYEVFFSNPEALEKMAVPLR